VPRPRAHGWSRCGGIFDLDASRRRIGEIDALGAAPGFWDDQRRAGEVMREHARHRQRVETWDRLDAESGDLVGLAELLDGDDPAMAADVDRELARLEAVLGELDVQLLLRGEYDGGEAFVTIQSGAGGTESQDWAEMLLRMYTRWAEDRRFATQVLDVSPGEEAGIKSATIRVSGAFAYGYLKAERGVHRLVRLSPFDASNRRHTSFARVDVMPALPDEAVVALNPEDLRVETFRSSSAGGQHVNKTDSAVRITHLPTGIVVTCQNQRSQHQNRDVALQVLRARLVELQLEEREQEQARLRGETRPVDFGSQIRSYVLHPYRLVKDLRTGVEIGDAASVLDGWLDPFMTAYLRAVLREGGTGGVA